MMHKAAWAAGQVGGPMSRDASKGVLIPSFAYADIVAYLRRRMDEFGITVDDLAALMAADTPAAARYRNAHGDAWDGNVKCLNG
jgi:class 3 adenylate cyclase